MGMFSDLHKQDIAEQQGQTVPAKPKRPQSTHIVDASVITAELTEPRAAERVRSAASQQLSAHVQEAQPPARPVDRPPAAATERSSAVAPGRPLDRQAIARKSFEVFQDQFDTLKRLALEDQLQGGKGNMSEMVREALDRFIADQQHRTE